MDPSDPAYRGQRDYKGPLLRLYDPLVLGPIARYVWHCPSSDLLAPYRQHMADAHLDVGPGTGYFLDHSGLAPGGRITILDPNADVLRHVSRRLTRYELTAVQADVLKPLPVDGPYASAALNLVIHCLPGPRARKSLAIANIAAVLAPDGVLFGATVLGRSGNHNRVARGFLAAFNRQGGFDNLDDTEDGTHEILEASFQEVEIRIAGSAALFVARRPRRPA